MMQATNKMQQLFRYYSLFFFNLLKSALHVSGDKFAHPQEHVFNCIYSFCYNASTLLLNGVTVGMELIPVPSQPWHRSTTVSVHCTKSCVYSQKVILRMGEFVARNM